MLRLISVIFAVFILILLIAITFINARKLTLAACKNILKRVFPALLFFVVTFAIFTPTSLFLSNYAEFLLRYTDIIPVILSVSFLLAIVIYFCAFFLFGEKHLPVFIAILFGISLSLYFQGNFLNPDLPTLDGTSIRWETYKYENIISGSFWILCLLLCLAFLYLRKEKTEIFMKYISYFLSAVQLVTLVVLLIITPMEISQSGYTKVDEFTIGSEENIILFVIDTLQASVMEEYITSEAYTDGALDDFTFFDNAVAGGATTLVALPVLLTGLEYDPTREFMTYNAEIWKDTEFYNDLHDNGYDVRFFTTSRYFRDPAEGLVDNFESTGKYWISDYPSFSLRFYQLVSFYLLPQCVKPYLLLPDRLIMEPITDGRFKANDIVFYSELQDAKDLQEKYEKAFRFYHLSGVHRPYYFDEDMEYTIDNDVTEQAALQGDLKIVYEYIEKLKQAGVYEKSMIIIQGDHGRHEMANIEDNPALLIKLPYESHELTHNSSPVHFRNMVATMAGTFLDDYSHYGPSVYDITQDSDVERLHTIHNVIRERTFLDDAYNTETKYTRLIINDRAGSGNYQIWYPYEINRIRYQIGDVIDFTKNDAYAEQINYRLYKENGAATASNELSICFELENTLQKDLELHFKYSDIYNDSQRILLYANGNKVENITCTKDGAGQEFISVISGEYLNDDKLLLRMVFPGAVTPNQLDRDDPDTRVLSVSFTSMWLE